MTTCRSPNILFIVELQTSLVSDTIVLLTDGHVFVVFVMNFVIKQFEQFIQNVVPNKISSIPGRKLL